MEKNTQNKTAYFTGLIYLVVMVGFVLLRVFSYLGFFDFPGGTYVARVLSQVVLFIAVPILLYSLIFKKGFKRTMKDFSFKKINAKMILFSFLIGIGMFVLVVYVSSLWSSLLGVIGFKFGDSGSGDFSVLSFILGLFFIGVMPALSEEISHRGLILTGTKKNGSVRAIVLCGLLFGLMHFNIVQFGYTFLVGMFLSFITLLTKSIFPAMIMHFTNNALGLVLSYSQNSTWMHNSVYDFFANFVENASGLTLVLVEMLILFVTVWLVSKLILKLFTESKKQNFLRFKQKFKKQIENTDLEKEIDINNDEQMLQIYREVTLLNLENKVQQNEITMQELFEGMSAKKTAEFVLSDNFEPPKKRDPKDYIFYYLAIFLGAAGTIGTLILGFLV